MSIRNISGKQTKTHMEENKKYLGSDKILEIPVLLDSQDRGQGFSVLETFFCRIFFFCF